ncbi:hypothetical protein REPUB_Repub16aG0123200 [Reevesia pubescens]
MTSDGDRKEVRAPLSKDELIDFIQLVILNEQQQEMDPFYVLDLGVVNTFFDTWTRNLPMVQPFYAVKCNPNPAFLKEMVALGTDFDCASRAEIETILSIGVSPDRNVFVNTCKPESHIKYAAKSHNFRAFEDAILAAKTTFETAAQLGMPKMHILNIDEGFTSGPKFTEAASAVKVALKKYFPNEPTTPGLTIMAKPGRFFTNSPFTLVTNIIGK